jgi:protein TonB
LLTPKILSYFFPGKVVVPDVIKVFEGTVLTQPPTFEQPPVQPSSPPPARQPNSNFTPQVTTEETDDVIPTNDDINANMDAVPDGEGTVPGPVIEVAPVEVPAPVEPAVVDFAEKMPAYDGGLQAMYQFIGKKIRYPSIARRNGVEGPVFVSFVVNKDGKVTDITVTRGISKECDEEAMRVIALLDKWTPGSQNHRAVNVRMTIPIKFQLEK